MKNESEFQNDVAETLLIPLYMRAKESARGAKAILRDPVAQDLVARIPYDYSKFDRAKLSEVGCNVRAWYLDNVVRNFIATHDNPVVVNLGCGLDARVQRTSEGKKAVYYSLDLPEVIATRSKLLPPADRETYISQSLFATDWMLEIRRKHLDSDFLFVAEGVLMYFEEPQIKSLFENFIRCFSRCEVWFDVCGSLTVKNQNMHDTLKNVSARFKWALDDGTELERWNGKIHLIKQSSQGMFFRWRYPLPMNVISRFPKLLFKFCSIVGYEIS